MIIKIIVSILALLGSGVITTSIAQEEPTPEELAIGATETRKAIFKLLSYNNRPISGMARGTVEFDAVIAERNALRIAALAQMIPELFIANDTRSFNVETRALPIIWDRMEDFEAKATSMVEAANIFAAIAAEGDRAKTIAAVREYGSNCGSCHDDYRAE
jgi:cytochrome c556